MNPLLLVLNPRRIPECIEAIERLDIDRAWLTGYTEPQLEEAIPDVLAATDHDPILVLSDDTIPTQQALDAVLTLWERKRQPAVATGFCNLDVTSQYVNLTRRPFGSWHSTTDAYDFYTQAEIGDSLLPVRSWFTGMCLTCMSRDLWERFPFQTYEGRSSDFMLSRRLQHDNIPILAPTEAMVWHVKERWNLIDQAPDKRLHLGNPETRLDLLDKPHSDSFVVGTTLSVGQAASYFSRGRKGAAA